METHTTYNPSEGNSTIPMEIKTAEKRTSFNPETNRWCCAMYGEGYWTGGFFGDTKEEAEKLALENYKKKVASIRGLNEARKNEEVTFITV